MSGSWARNGIGIIALGSFLIALVCMALIGALRLAAEEEGRPSGPSLAESKARTVLDMMDLGRELFYKKDYRHAAIEFEKVADIDPSNSAAAEYLKLCKKRLEGQ